MRPTGAYDDSLTFATPELLAVAVIVPLLILGIAMLERARRKVLLGRLGEAPVVQRLMASVSPGRRRIKRALQAGGVALIIVAAARPQLPGEARRGSEGLDLVIALDASKSMLVDDVGTTRLAKARAVTSKLIDALPGDRISPLVFGGAAAHFPLTDDKSVAKHFLAELGPLDLPQGSNLSEALRVATCVLRPDVEDKWSDDCAGVGGRGKGGDPLPEESEESDLPRSEPEVELEERAKVVLLVTDSADGLGSGADDSDLEPLVEVRRAVKLGVTVMVMGVGTTDGGLVPDIDADGKPLGPKRDRDGNQVRSKLDPASLRLLAEAGGEARRYFEVGEGDFDVAIVTEALNNLKRGALSKKNERVMYELYHFFLFPGFLLLIIEACLGTRRRVKYPEVQS